jgi:glycosyltransferase involved in cell wall biosynthesis
VTDQASKVAVSVAMCTCQGSAFLEKQLRSIAEQTRLPDELILCDDCSTDASVSIARSFSERSPFPVRLIENHLRLGVTKNFEQAMSLCSGNIIVLADQDDLWLPPKIERLAAALTQQNAGAAFCDAIVTDAEGKPVGYTLWDAVWFTPSQRRRFRAGAQVEILLQHAVAAGTTLAFCGAMRDLIMPIPNLPHAHDIWISTLAAAVGRLALVDEPLMSYRLHGANHVGLKQWSLLEQIGKAKEQVQIGAFRYAVDLYQAALDRLLQYETKYPVLDQHVIKLFQQKIDHSKFRDSLPKSWPARWPGIGRELFNGGYSKYSYGWKSVLQDLFLR